MRVHAIQTGTVMIKEEQRRARARAYPLRLATTLFSRNWTTPQPILCWAIEHPEGLIVVDTGETAAASGPGYFPAWNPYFRLAARMQVTEEDEVGPQLERAGLSASDVRWVVMTHLHTDHAGGLATFPRAEILVSRTELATARGIAGRVAGYLPNRWPSWFSPVQVDHTDPGLRGFPASQAITAAGDVHIVPTPGHTPGHQSVIVDDGDRQLFLAGDTSYGLGPLLDGAIDGVCRDAELALATTYRVRAYVKESGAVYLPSHDPQSVDRLARSTA